MTKRVYAFTVVLLLIVIAVEWFFPEAPPVIPSRGSVAVNLADTSFLVEADRAADFPPEEAYQSIADRPLFFEGRRPPASSDSGGEPLAPPSTTRVTKPRGKLTGVVVVGNDVYALVSESRKKGAQRFKVGDTIEGWSVEKITSDKLVLTNNSERHEMPLREYKAVPLPKAKTTKAQSTKKAAQPADSDKSRQAAILKKNRKEKE